MVIKAEQSWTNFEKEFLKKFNYMDNVFLISSAIEDKLVTKKNKPNS